MGLLFTKLLKRLTGSKEEHKIVIVGLDNAGKTTILYQILLNEVVVTSPTIGSNVEEVVYKNLHFLVWDIGGQDALRSTWSTYYTNAKCLIMVIDSTDRERISISKSELYQVYQPFIKFLFVDVASFPHQILFLFYFSTVSCKTTRSLVDSL
eukprot:Sdes_comp9997_c0_seq2m1580